MSVSLFDIIIFNLKYMPITFILKITFLEICDFIKALVYLIVNESIVSRQQS